MQHTPSHPYNTPRLAPAAGKLDFQVVPNTVPIAREYVSEARVITEAHAPHHVTFVSEVRHPPRMYGETHLLPPIWCTYGETNFQRRVLFCFFFYFEVFFPCFVLLIFVSPILRSLTWRFTATKRAR